MSGGGSGSQVIGFRYYFGIHMGVSKGPVDELVEVAVADKTVWRGNVTSSGTVDIDAPDVFGGDSGEGGIKGTLQVLMGEASQVAHSAMARVLRSPMPGFRRRFTLFYDGLVCSRNPYPKPWKVRMRRAIQGWDGECWYPEKAIISLRRKVGAGEIQGGASVETQTLTGSVRTYLDHYHAASGWNPSSAEFETKTITLTTTDTDTPTIVSVRPVPVTFNIHQLSLPLYTLGVDYTVTGNVVTFLHNDIPTGNFFDVEYTYPYQEVAPTTGGIGDSLIQSMNPVHIVYEAYTNREWGEGLIEVVSTMRRGDLLPTRSLLSAFGMCIRWTRTDTIKAFVKGVLDQLGATVYTDRATAKIKIQLIRGGYDKATIPLYEPGAGLLDVRENSISMASNGVNQVVVKYRDPVTDKDMTVRASNLAAVRSAGGSVNSITKEYPGAPTAEIAMQLARRDLQAMSPSIRRFEITLDRRAYKTIAGGLIRIRDRARNIPDTVLRVGTVDYGTLGQGSIKVNALQDVFSLPTASPSAMGPSQWTPPASRPCAGLMDAFEMPYRFVYRMKTTAEFDYVDETSAFIGAVCQEGQPTNMAYQLAVKQGAIANDELPPDNSYVCGI